MIKCILIYLLLLTNLLYAQVDIKNLSLIDPGINILYTGIYNKIEITGIRDTIDLKLISDRSKVSQSYNSNNYLINPGYYNTDTLRIYLEGKLMLIKIYEIKQIEDPIAQLGKVTDSIATVEQIVTDPTISVK